MWPFTKKTLKTPTTEVAKQVLLALKSYSMPQLTPNWKLYASRDMRWNTDTAIIEGYNASAVVYACVEKRATAVASVPWVAKLNGEAQPNSPLQKLLDKPNDDQSLSEVMHEVVQQKDLSGNAYLSEVRGGIDGLPFQLWTLPSQYVAIKPGKERLIDYYEYKESQTTRIPADDMVHIRNPNPNSRYFGMPKLMAAGRATDIDRESGDWQKSRLQNKTASDLHIKVPEGTGQDVIEQVRDQVAKRYAGADNAGKPMVTSGDVNFIGQSAQEMDFINSRKAVWGEICAAFGVPLAMLGFTESVNLANAKEMKRLFWEDTVIPELDLIKRQLNHQLAVEFGDGWSIEYDLSNVSALKEDMTVKLQNAERLQRLGYTRNEINMRLELGFDDTDSGDIRYEPTGLLPIGSDVDLGGVDDAGDELTAQEKRLIKAIGYGEK